MNIVLKSQFPYRPSTGLDYLKSTDESKNGFFIRHEIIFIYVPGK